MKTYQYKLYSRLGTFKEDITGIVTSQTKFTSQMNGGQGQMTIDLNAPFDLSGVIKTDIIKITCFSDKFPEGILVYSGFVSKITRRYEKSKTTISLTVLGIASLLAKMTITGTYNTDPANIINSIISTYNSTRGGLDISIGTLETVGTNMNIEFSGTSCMDALKQVANKTNKWFYIGPDATINFIDNVSLIRASIDGEIENITAEDDLEKVVNSIEVEWSGGVASATNAPSIALYDVMKSRITNKELKDLSSANAYCSEYLSKNADPDATISITINDKYEEGIETIIPGMFINILNSNVVFNNLQILKVEYTNYSVRLDISSFNSFAKELIG